MHGRLPSICLALLAVAGAGSLTGCGTSDEEKVEKVVRTYLRAVADGDGEAACAQLTERAQTQLAAFVRQQLPQLKETGCPEIVDKLGGLLPEPQRAQLRDADVQKVEVTGEEATVTIGGAARQPQLRKVDGDWRIETGFAAG